MLWQCLPIPLVACAASGCMHLNCSSGMCGIMVWLVVAIVYLIGVLIVFSLCRAARLGDEIGANLHENRVRDKPQVMRDDCDEHEKVSQ